MKSILVLPVNYVELESNEMTYLGEGYGYNSFSWIGFNHYKLTMNRDVVRTIVRAGVTSGMGALAFATSGAGAAAITTGLSSIFGDLVNLINDGVWITRLVVPGVTTGFGRL